MEYICIKSFESLKGIKYKKGSKIITPQYFNDLTHIERRNFEMPEDKRDETNSIDSTTPSTIKWEPELPKSYDSQDFSITSDPQQDNSTEFGGGDSGGGGASGDF